MHRLIFALAASAALTISSPAFAQHGRGGGKPTTSPTHGPSTTTHGSSGATTHGQSGAHGPAAKPASSHGAHVSGDSHASGAKTHSSGGTKTKTAKSTTTATTTSSTTGVGSTTTLTPVQQKLQKNTNLADKLRSRLPANTNLMDAANGFKNLGQFVAAVNVSNNHHLEFSELKTRMVDQGMSLGQALQDVKKTTNVETEVRSAEAEADRMIKSSTTSTVSTTTASTSTKKTAKKAKTTKKTGGNE
jgi:hypothetical protein